MNLSSDLDRTVARHGERIALVYSTASGEEKSMTYRELGRKTLQAAAAFQAAGVGKGDCVAIVHRNDPAFITAYFGLIRLGAVAVPINFMIQSPAELRFMLGHCGAKGVVTQKDFLPGLLSAREELPGLEHVWTSDAAAAPGAEPFWPFVDSAAPLEAAPASSPEDTVMILYTSGTTGEPKGVMLTHSNLVSNCEAANKALDIRSDDVWLTVLPMFHTFAWTACVLMPLRVGGKIVIAASPAPPDPWLAAMLRHQVTLLPCVPQIFVLLSSQAAGYRDLILREGYFSSLRLCISGAAPLSPQVHKEFMDSFGLEIIEGYGMTETSPVVSLNPIGSPKPGSVGLTVSGVSVRIVDEDGRELPRGQEGEILIHGPNVMKGYYHNDEATRQTITAGWLKSGDVGAIDEQGYLHIRDRKKDMIIVKGLKVFPAQIEKVLMTQGAVGEVAVIGIPDATGDERIKAFVVPRKGAQVEIADLRAFCREKFDSYKRPVEFEIVAELPKNALQKVLKRVLRQREIAKRVPAAA